MFELTTDYNATLVVLSVLVASFSSFVALTFVPRIHDARVKPRRANLWVLMFGISLGAGIWSMHFIGMLALNLSVPVRYNVVLTLLSLGVGIVFAALGALPIRRGGEIGGWRLAAMGVLIGSGISGMHYTGMAAMHMAAGTTYNTSLVALSVLIAVFASTTVLWIANRLKSTRVLGELRMKLIAAVIMGLAISSMHYTGMVAAHFMPSPVQAQVAYMIDPQQMTGLPFVIMFIVFLTLGGSLLLAMLDEAVAGGREQYRSLHAILDYAPVGIWQLDEHRCMRFMNPAFCDAVGVEERRFLEAEHYSTVLPGDVSANCMDSDEQCFTSKQEVSSREDIPCVDGRVHTFDITKTPILDEDGCMRGLVGLAMDITDRLEAEQHLRENEQRYRALFDGSRAAIMQVVEQGSSRFEWVHRRMDGTDFPTVVHLTRIDIGGRMVIHAIVTDMSERVQAEAERERMQRQLEHTQRLESLGVLAGGIAHDFNNLLTAILGNASLARMKVNDEAVTRHLLHIEDSSQRAAELCQQMLAYSGKARFEIKPINFSQMIQNISELLQVSISKNVELRLQLEEELPEVEADAAQWQQVVMNLIINASDAIGDEHGMISLHTGVMQADAAYLQGGHVADGVQPGTFVFLEVEDTGCGMDKETQEKLFDPFFTTKFTGRGLGMSAVLGIVYGHHGAISVYSEFGKGTRFRVLLPMLDVSVSDQAGERPEDNVDDWRSSGTVLVVDDEETIREIAVTILTDVGFNTLTAADGEEAVEAYRRHQREIVAVLLDMTMPNMDGKACMEELRQINQDVVVLLSSGYSEYDVAGRFADQNLSGFIQKPYTQTALRAKMRQVLSVHARTEDDDA